jgi:hypothetical protein
LNLNTVAGAQHATVGHLYIREFPAGSGDTRVQFNDERIARGRRLRLQSAQARPNSQGRKQDCNVDTHGIDPIWL